MITEERLQEIKVVYTLPYGEEYPTEAAHDLGMDIAELIAAYEQVQVEKEYWKDETYDFRKQLAEAQAECERLRNMRGFTPDASRDK